MYSRLNCLLSGLLCLLLITPSMAQEWSFGPKTYLGLSRVLTVGDEALLPIGYISTVADGDATMSGLGVFARYDRPRWYAELDAIQGKSYAANINIQSRSISAPLYPSARRYDARLIVGYKPLPWLRLSAGLVGVANNWKQRDNTAEITRLEALAQAEQNPSMRERFQYEAEYYRLNDIAGKALKQNVLEAQLGIGADIGGLTLDLTYNPGLSPSIDGIAYQARTYALRQRYAYWSLGIGYKLFPLKSHLTAPRKNKAYARIQRDIPFIRNEFHVGLGILFEDVNSAFIYENRYTRYIRPRLGWTVGLTYLRGLGGFEPVATSAFQTGGFSATNTISLLAGARVLPLYSRQHRIGLTVGAQLTYVGGSVSSSGSYRTVTVNGQTTVIRPVTLTAGSHRDGFSVTPQASIDYQFLPTDRLAIGPWLRATPDFGSYGLQAGYRF
ncbi:hypothetical protein [uncultured Fibrella sp.]|uniref:hypothetical protein n=1 Tax=uncultured Fibrella sp. TaxID=1284596 RepID=UPI0035CB7AF2